MKHVALQFPSGACAESSDILHLSILSCFDSTEICCQSYSALAAFYIIFVYFFYFQPSRERYPWLKHCSFYTNTGLYINTFPTSSVLSLRILKFCPKPVADIGTTSCLMIERELISNSSVVIKLTYLITDMLYWKYWFCTWNKPLFIMKCC